MTTLRRQLEWVLQGLRSFEKETGVSKEKLANFGYVLAVVKERLASARSNIPCCTYTAKGNDGSILIGCDFCLMPLPMNAFEEECLRCQRYLHEKIDQAERTLESVTSSNFK